MARRHLINVHSSIEGKVPGVEAADMRYGELAVNHSKGKAFISTRVSETDMELFPSVHYIEQYPFSSLTVNGLTTLSGTTKIEKIVASDNTFDNALDSGSTNAVQNKVITKVITKVIQENEEAISASLNDLNKRKANVSDLASHTGNSTVHITSAERTKWDNASTSSHIHANKDVLDTITSIDTALSATSNNLVTNSAITKAIQDNEEAISASLNDLNKRVLALSSKTPTYDTALDSGSTNAVQNKVITKVIQENEEAISSALNDLNKKIATMEQEINTLKTEINTLKNKS